MVLKQLFSYKLFFLLLINWSLINAQDQVYEIEGNKYLYSKPNAFDFILNMPTTFASVGSSMFNKEYTVPNIIIGTSTAAFILVDQPVYDQVSEWGRQWGLGNGDNTKTVLTVGGYPLFRGPTDWGSAMYFLGDGWTHLGLGLSFLTAGLINDDNRALQTASQIAQGMLTVGFTTQFMKHIFGRETPGKATSTAGKWRFFPNQIDYHKHVPKYDAFPSGHVATAMMTLTVIANNYEEYKWINPVGYGLITVLSFQMINNGVHWISDYPLALGIGYLFGKIIVDSGRKKLNDNVLTKEKVSYSIFPQIGLDNSYRLSFHLTF
ncbi:MAG: phosphatase PAP2 family protein [Melioribacteraceae bacterium]|nr:phosphatase PAP2 family protein [Melioribacteraceae bacterium]